MVRSLHRRGLLRVAHRAQGVRCYAAADDYDPHPPTERYQRLVTLAAQVLGPLPFRSLRSLAAGLRRRVPEIRDHVGQLRALVAAGALVQDGDWIWPAGLSMRDDAPARVRLLAPFDPLVWDRGRFERFWGWGYRFEAYTPKDKRVRGYYAMPLLYRDGVIGWANLSAQGETLRVEVGFEDARPSEAAFDRLLEEEAQAMARFLGLEAVAWA